MYLLRAEAKAPHLVEDLVGGLGPSKGLVALVMRVDVREDGLAELRDARVGSALEGLLRQQPKESFHQVRQDA